MRDYEYLVDKLNQKVRVSSAEDVKTMSVELLFWLKDKYSELKNKQVYDKAEKDENSGMLFMIEDVLEKIEERLP